MSAQVRHLDERRESRRTPPHSVEAEEAVIGGCLLDPAMIPVALEIVQPADCYRPQHQLILAAIAELTRRGITTDLVTLADLLRGRGELAEVGGAAFISELVERVPTAANLPYYAQIVRRDADRRRVIAAATELALRMHEDAAPLAESLPPLLEPLLGLELARRGRQSLGASVVDTMARLEAETDGRRQVGVTTGLHSIDRKLGGYCRGTWVVIAGRPSMGKSSLADTSILAEARAGHRPALISLEQSTDRSVRRLLAKMADVNLHRMKTGSLSAEEMRRLQIAADELSRLPLQIVDDQTCGSDWGAVQVTIRRLVSEGAEIIFLDHIGLLELGGGSAQRLTAQDKMRTITRQLKRLAVDLDVPLVTLCQINREAAKVRGRKQQERPGMHQLRDSGTIEQDADDILLLHRPWYYDKSQDAALAEVIIAKQRDGGVGQVELRFSAETANFADYYQPELL